MFFPKTFFLFSFLCFFVLFKEGKSDGICSLNNNDKIQSLDCAYDNNATACGLNNCCYAQQTQQFQCGDLVDEGSHTEAECSANGFCWNSTTSQCFQTFNYVISQCSGSPVSLIHQDYNNCTIDTTNCWNGTQCFSKFVPSCFDQNTTSSINQCGSSQWRVDFLGKSGQFKFYPCADSNFFIKVDLLSIQGYDSNGKETNDKVTSFAYESAVQGEYEASSSFTYNGGSNTVTLAGVRLNYTWEISKTTVYMLMYVYILDTDYQLSLGGNLYSLKQNSLKFSYEIIGFPVTADDVTTIDLSARLTTGGNFNSWIQNGTAFSWGQNCQTAGCGTFSFQAPSEATIDGETKNNVDITFDTTGSGKQVTVTFSFKNFNDNDNDGLVDISYDPWFLGSYIDGSSGSSGANTTSSGSSSGSNNGSSASRFYVNINIIFGFFVLLFISLF